MRPKSGNQSESHSQHQSLSINEPAISSTLLLCICIGSIPSFQMGFSIGVLNPLTIVASDHLNCSPTDFLGWPLIVSSFCPAGFLGSQIATWSMKKGLASALNISCIICIVANLLCGAAAFVPRHGFNLLLLGRVLAGLASGIGTVVSPVYFAEISPPHLRGIIGASYQLATVAGILTSQLMATPMATQELYGWLLLSPIAFSLIQLIMAPFALVESPAWLRRQGLEEEARKATLRLNGASSRTIEDGKDRTPTPIIASASLVEVAKDPKLGAALFLLLTMLIGQQFCGINALFFYSTDFFKLAGLDNPTLGTLMASGINVVAVMAVLPLLVKTARRKMMLIGLVGMLVSASILTSTLVLVEDEEDVISPTGVTGALEVVAIDHEVMAPVSYVPMVSLTVVLSFIVCYELSIGLVPWIVGLELFPPHAKDAAFSCASGANWFANFVVGLVFPVVQSTLGAYCFVPFILSIVVTLSICFALLPETLGQSWQENLDHLTKKGQALPFCRRR